MIRTLFIFLSFLMIGSGSYAQNWDRISHKIKQEQLKIPFFNNLTKTFINNYHQCRKRINILNDLKVNTLVDTIYIVECHSDGSDLHMISNIWNHNKVISYKKNFNENDITTLNNSEYYPKYIKELALSWNIPEIRKEEKLHSNFIPINYIYLTRIIFKNNKPQIDCICFKDFFLPERDVNNYF